MTLSPRQQIFYTDRCDIYLMSQESDAGTGLFLAKHYTLSQAGVPCHFRIRQSVENPGPFGRIEGDNIFTRDEVHFPADVVVDSDAILVNKTLDALGLQTQNYGKYWIISGKPKSISRRGSRRAEKRSVDAVQVELAPPGVP